MVMTDYSRGLMKQVEELTIENEKLKEENTWLRAENKNLNRKMDNLLASMDARIERAVALAVAPLQAALAEEEAKQAKAHSEIMRLKSSLGKDSSNSSKPPSTDGFKKIVNSRVKSGRKVGGQKGHKAHQIKLPENLDTLVANGFAEKRIADHTDNSAEYITRYEIDIETKAIYIEHRFPKDYVFQGELCNKIYYGKNLKALTVLLIHEGLIATERLGTLYSAMTNGALHVSGATLHKYLGDFSDRLQPELEVITRDLLDGKALNVDETPMRSTERLVYGEGAKAEEAPVLETAEQGTFGVTVRNYSNDHTTRYTANAKKDIAGVDRDDILPRFIGILSHDHDAKYYNYGTAHAPCGTHLLRELKGLEELYVCPWAGRMGRFMAGLNEYKKAGIAAGKKECPAEQFETYAKSYDELLLEGAAEENQTNNELGREEQRRLITRLTKYKKGYLLFLEDYDAPFTNNLSERDLRWNKTKQKVSGCFRSWAGLVHFTRIRSFISTLKKRSLPVLNSIALVFSGQPVLS
jgi:hypothetical protein